MPIGPRESHLLDQYMAMHLEVQAKLKQFERDLIATGYDKAEAWALARRLEERLLAPMMDYTAKARYVEEQVDELIRLRLEELDALESSSEPADPGGRSGGDPEGSP